MSTVTFHGDAVEVSGQLPQVGQSAPDFTLTNDELKEISLADFKGKKLILNIFPSVDTGVCANSVRQFNEKAANLSDATVLCVSMDLPFAFGRFCEAEGIDNLKVASAFRHSEFLENYGVKLASSPLKGLAARTVIVLNEQGQVLHVEQVAEIGEEPNYDEALAAIN